MDNMSDVKDLQVKEIRGNISRQLAIARYTPFGDPRYGSLQISFPVYRDGAGGLRGKFYEARISCVLEFPRNSSDGFLTSVVVENSDRDQLTGTFPDKDLARVVEELSRISGKDVRLERRAGDAYSGSYCGCRGEDSILLSQEESGIVLELADPGLRIRRRNSRNLGDLTVTLFDVMLSSRKKPVSYGQTGYERTNNTTIGKVTAESFEEERRRSVYGR